jgi:5-enolpyruvylshikimate-3-phosphate synthase
MLGGIADGQSAISGFLASEDCLATLAALSALGVRIERPQETLVQVHGAGRDGLRPPRGAAGHGQRRYRNAPAHGSAGGAGV